MKCAIVLALIAASCGAPSEPSNRATPAPPAVAQHASPPVVHENPACDGDASQLTVELLAGQTLATPVGVEVTFFGADHADYDDGRSDDWVSLRFRRGGAVEHRIVSLYAPRRADEVFDGCWR